MLIPSDHLPSPVALTDAPPASTTATPASLTQMAAILGHEIRTPMNAMIGVLSLLLETNLDDEQRDYVMTVRSASDAMLTVINDFLDMARIDAGRLRLEAIPFDLRTTVEELVHLFAGQAAARGLELNHIVHHDVPPLLVGDPGRLRQVLANLISNAIKFTEHGEVTVRVRALKTGGDHARIRIDVSDTGIGMTEA